MSSLIRWQFASLVSRLSAVIIGLVQGIFVVRLLSTGEYGLVGIVTSIGSVIGVYEHLGLASGTIREISVQESLDDSFKVFVSSLLVRFLVSFPLALGLFFLAPWLAHNVYSAPAILIPLRMYSVVLLVQGSQSISNAALAGIRKFGPVLVYQGLIALFSLGSYIFSLSRWGFQGYFVAMLAVTTVGSLSLLGITLHTFWGEFEWPRKDEIISILRNIFKVGLAIYVVKIIFTFWQKLGPLFLGAKLPAEEVGYFNFALLYGTKMLPVSDSFSSINLPVMSKKFVNDLASFKRDFLHNFYKLFSFIWVAAISAIFWIPEVVHLLVGRKYDAAFNLMPPLVLAFTAYALLNLLGASVIVPAKMLKELVSYYVVLIVGTVLAYFAFTFLGMNVLLAVSWASFFGAFTSLLLLLYFIYQHLDFVITDRCILLLGVSLLPLVGLSYILVNPFYKGLVFTSFVGGYLVILSSYDVFSFKKLFKFFRLWRGDNAS